MDILNFLGGLFGGGGGPQPDSAAPAQAQSSGGLLDNLFGPNPGDPNSRGIGGFLNDYFRNAVPHVANQNDYNALQQIGYGTPAPDGQMFATGNDANGLTKFADSSGGMLSGSPYAAMQGPLSHLPAFLGAPILQSFIQNAGKTTDLGPGHNLINGTGATIAQNTDETYGEPVTLSDGRAARFGNRGGVKVLGTGMTPAVKGEAQAPGTQITNPYNGSVIASAPQGFKTLSPQELGIGNDTVSPGTIFQQGPDGRISVVKASDVDSAAAVKQKVGLAGADAQARAQAQMQVNNPTGPNGEAVGTLGRPEIDTSVPGYATAPIKEAGGLTQSAIDQGGMELAITGRMPSGMGLGSTGIGGLRKTAIQNRAAELNTNGNMAGNAAQLNALRGSLGQQTKYADTTERAVANAENGFNQVVTTFKGKVNNSQIPIVNAMKNAALYQLAPGDIASFKAGLTEVANEYAQVFSRGGQMTDQVRNRANDIVSGNLSIADLTKVMNELKAQGDIVAKGARGQAGKIQGQFNDILSGKAPSPAAPAAANIRQYDARGNRIQ